MSTRPAGRMLVATFPGRAGAGGRAVARNIRVPEVDAPMLDDVLHRRPYNAVTDLVDGNVARGLGARSRSPIPRVRCATGSCRRGYRFASACGHSSFARRIASFWCFMTRWTIPSRSGGDPRRHYSHSDQYAAHGRAICLPVRRQPRGRDRGRRCARSHRAVDPLPAAASARGHRDRSERRGSSENCATCCFSRICCRPPRRRSPPRRCPMKWRSGCTRRARPAIPRRSGTFTPARWQRRGSWAKASSASARTTWYFRRRSFLLLRSRQCAVVSAVRRRERGAAAGAADAAGRARDDSPPSSDHLLRRAFALCGSACACRRSAPGAGLGPAAAVHLGGRGAAGPSRRALARRLWASTFSTASARPRCCRHS